MTTNEASTDSDPDRSSTGLLALGGFGAVLLSACCVLPLVLVMAGLGGAWLAHLHALYPYRWLILGLSAVALVLAWRRLYCPASECADGEVCAVPPVRRGYRVLFWIVTVLVASSAVAPYLLGALLN